MGKVKLTINEGCENCAHRFGPIALACGNPDSEFYHSFVHPLGYCPGYKRDSSRRLILASSAERK